MFQSNPELVHWRLHLNAAPARVYEFLATDDGRSRFWAESAVERDGAIEFTFPNGATWRGEILDRVVDKRFSVKYYGDSSTIFELHADGRGGTELVLNDGNVPAADRIEVIAGWVSVLMQLKAAVDHGIDLRNHDPARTWDEGFAEN